MHVHLPLAMFFMPCPNWPSSYAPPLQTRRARTPADNIALWLVHYMSAQGFLWVIGESEYKGVLTNQMDQ